MSRSVPGFRSSRSRAMAAGAIVLVASTLAASSPAVGVGTVSTPLVTASSSTLAWSDTDARTVTAEMAAVRPGGKITLTLPKSWDLRGVTVAGKAQNASTTTRFTAVGGAGVVTVTIPSTQPKGQMMLTVRGVKVGGANATALDVMTLVDPAGSTRATSSARVAVGLSSRVVTLTPGRSVRLRLPTGDPVVAAAVRSATKVTAHFGPYGGGAPFELDSSRLATTFDRSAASVTVTLPLSYPLDKYPRFEESKLTLAFSGFADPAFSYMGVDVPVTLSAKASATSASVAPVTRVPVKRAVRR